jgi:hypothetical protein
VVCLRIEQVGCDRLNELVLVLSPLSEFPTHHYADGS